jgi:predicted amidophosphoribosyltransferase
MKPKIPKFLNMTLNLVNSRAQIMFCPYCQQDSDCIVDYERETFFCDRCGKHASLDTLVDDLCEAIHHYEFAIQAKIDENPQRERHLLQISPSNTNTGGPGYKITAGFNAMNDDYQDDEEK